MNFIGSTARTVAMRSSALCWRPDTYICEFRLPITKTNPFWKQHHTLMNGYCDFCINFVSIYAPDRNFDMIYMRQFVALCSVARNMLFKLWRTLKLTGPKNPSNPLLTYCNGPKDLSSLPRGSTLKFFLIIILQKAKNIYIDKQMNKQIVKKISSKVFRVEKQSPYKCRVTTSVNLSKWQCQLTSLFTIFLSDRFVFVKCLRINAKQN